MPKPTGIERATNITEDPEEGTQLHVCCRHANWKLYRLFRPLAVLLFLFSVAVPVVLIVLLAEADKENKTTSILPTFGITFVTVLIIVLGSILWVAASDLKGRKVTCSTDGQFIWLWTGRQLIEIDPKVLKHIAIIPVTSFGYYLGLGIAGRRWIYFGKGYGIEMTTQENMTTTAELPFDQPDCQWICTILEEMKKGIN